MIWVVSAFAFVVLARSAVNGFRTHHHQPLVLQQFFFHSNVMSQRPQFNVLRLRKDDDENNLRQRVLGDEEENIFDATDVEDESTFNNSRGKRSTTRRRSDRNRPVLFNGVNKWQLLNRAIYAGIFVAGIGLGEAF